MSQFSSRSTASDALTVALALFGVVYATLFLGQLLFGVALALVVVLVYFLWRLVLTGEAIVDALQDSAGREEF